MMLRIRTVALAAALMVGASTMAIAQEAPRDTSDRMRHGRMKAGQPRAQRALLRGITLSEAQKSRLEAIRESYRPRYQSMRESMRPRMQALRDARQKNDTAALRAARAQLEQQRAEARTLAERQRNEVRGVLSPEQQATFDKNVAEMRDRMANRAEHRREHRKHGRKGGRRGA